MNNKISPHHFQGINRPNKPIKVNTTNQSFQSIFAVAIENNGKLKISKHAEKRISDRGIKISNEMWGNIYSKIIAAKQKGITDTIVVTKEAALVINTKNETVITAMDRKEAESQIFTNINGAILMD